MIDFDIEKYDAILARGLSEGLGKAGGQVCIEAAICEVLGLGHSDDPKCVSKAVRRFKISLNDSKWSSPQARAKGLRELGIAQLGSLSVVDDIEFAKRLSEKIIRVLIPKLFRELFPENQNCLDAAKRCEDEGSSDAASYASDASSAASDASYASDASSAASDASSAASYASSAASDAASYASDAASDASSAASYASSAASSDSYLRLAADLALEVLRELKSPGCELLGEGL
jgi:hypothetical protein